MKLRICLPTMVLVDEEVLKVVVDAENGSHGLLPRHVDFVTALAPGILSYWTQAGGEHFVAVDEGVLVKVGPQVLVSTRHAVQHSSLEDLRSAVNEDFQAQDERERQARTALARLESATLERFLKLEARWHA